MLALLGVAMWLAMSAERDMPWCWVFERSHVEIERETGDGPFRVASEPSERRVSWDDRAERRALARARVASVAFPLLVVGVAVTLTRALPADASLIVLGWALACAGLMVRDQLCREWWMAAVGPVAIVFACLIDPQWWWLALLVWLAHLALRLAVELRVPRPPSRDASN
jgi:hypothetical protein